MPSRNEIGAHGLNAIHAASNRRKHEAYWLGFLKGIMASGRIEKLEPKALEAECRLFADLIGDDDAVEIVRDIHTNFSSYEQEIFDSARTIFEVRIKEFGEQSPTDRRNLAYGFFAGIACDNRITLEEIDAIRLVCQADYELRGDWRIRNLLNHAEDFLKDGTISASESQDLCEWIAAIVGDSYADTGLPSFGQSPSILYDMQKHGEITFTDKNFVLTGTFSVGPRKIIGMAIAQAGGRIYDFVVDRTDYLCIGLKGSPNWGTSSGGKKIQAAHRLRGSGTGPKSIDEGSLVRALLSVKGISPRLTEAMATVWAPKT